MVGSIVSDLEVEALADVVAKLKIEVCLLTAFSEVFELLSSLPPSLPGQRVGRRKVAFYLLLMLDT